VCGVVAAVGGVVANVGKMAAVTVAHRQSADFFEAGWIMEVRATTAPVLSRNQSLPAAVNPSTGTRGGVRSKESATGGCQNPGKLAVRMDPDVRIPPQSRRHGPRGSGVVDLGKAAFPTSETSASGESLVHRCCGPPPLPPVPR
jgi:hypothetical protein